MAVVEKTVYNIREKITKITNEVLTSLGLDGTAESIEAVEVKADAAKATADEVKNKIDTATTLADYNIANAYTKTETDNAIATAVANADHLKRAIVENLPEVDAADANTIYMVPIQDGSGDQRYNEYMYINDAFEKIGSSEVVLTGYATEDYVNTEVQSVTTAYEAADTTLSTNLTTAYETADTTTLEIAKTYADGLSMNYATAAQGAKADTAVQAEDIVEGLTAGTIHVKDQDVPIHGLGTAAFANANAFAPASSVITEEQIKNIVKTVIEEMGFIPTKNIERVTDIRLKEDNTLAYDLNDGTDGELNRTTAVYLDETNNLKYTYNDGEDGGTDCVKNVYLTEDGKQLMYSYDDGVTE